MRTILIAIDGSAPASAAVAAGLELAADESAEVVLVHVISILDLSSTTSGGKSPSAFRVPRMIPFSAPPSTVREQLTSLREPSC